jgi:hypothetical protein
MDKRLKELAEQAGFIYYKKVDAFLFHIQYLERFAELVRQDEAAACAEHYLKIMRDAVEQAVLKEREACAKLCEDEMNRAYQEEAKFLPRGNNDLLRIAQGASYCVHAIRARGTT